LENVALKERHEKSLFTQEFPVSTIKPHVQ